MIHSLLSRRALLCLGALGSLTAITSTAALAQASYPSRPITLIVPFPPGGPADANGRLIARKLASSLGQPVVVDNKPGASGAIGAEAAARAAPDGYTLFAGTMGTHALNPALQGNLRYDPVKDFVPLHTTIATVNVLVVNAERPYKTLGEFVAFARQNPGRINYGSAGGPGTGNTLAAELFQQAAGVQHVKDGKLRALAVGHTQRVDMLPGVPTMTEAGIANAELITWGGIFAPSGTPRAITQRLTTELARVMRDPEVVSSITEAGAIAYSVGGDDFAALVQRDLTRWSRLPKAGQ
jgi:tripartite-type tricarboxylate transporter receptor subunit TctC